MAEEKELRKMNRTELIEIIYALKKEEEEVKPTNAETTSKETGGSGTAIAEPDDSDCESRINCGSGDGIESRFCKRTESSG